MNVRAACLAAVLLFCAVAPAEPPLSGIYLHPSEFADAGVAPAEREARMDAALDKIRRCGFTTLIPYANTSSGRAYWTGSDLAMAGPEDWDTLAVLAEKARARGMKVMPAVCLMVSGDKEPKGILEAHPEWALRDLEGNPLGYISAANPEARAWVVELVRNLAAHVRPEGIMLDYLRFPNRTDIRLDPEGERLFEARNPADTTLQNFKEASLTQLMKDIHGMLRKEHPECRIGLYTWGANVAQNHPVAQNWSEWKKMKLLDVLNVSGYCYTENYGDNYMEAFKKRLLDAKEKANVYWGDQVELTFALGVLTSHGAVKKAEEIGEYLAVARAAGYPGVAAFAWKSMEQYTDDAEREGWFRIHQTEPVSESRFTIRMTVEFGKDRGQNLGSLFELRDTEGRVVGGAGFTGAYNTYYRSDRTALHAYLRAPGAEDSPVFTPIPRPSESCQHYLSGGGNYVVATDRKSQDSAWSSTRLEYSWSPQESAGLNIGQRYLKLLPNLLTLDGAEVFRFDPAKGTAGSYYYGEGALFYHVADADSPERRTHLYAVPWDPYTESAVPVEKAVVLDLPAPGEFPYAWGQHDGAVVVASNNGGFYRFRAGAWETLRPADPKTSFQIYTMLNYRGRLLMGQYPTGELFELVGDELRHLPGCPPRAPGASPRAREAQSMAIYRGDLYVGVWPWGELWRMKDPEGEWDYVGRLFTHPEIRPEVTAPYEAEMTALGEKVNNLWGQRITSLVPLTRRLIISTANKNGAPYEPRLEFLSDDRWREYGAVHEMYLRGHNSTNMGWKEGPQEIAVYLSSEGMDFYLEGDDDNPMSVLGDMSRIVPGEVVFGDGIQGPFQGKILRQEVIR